MSLNNPHAIPYSNREEQMNVLSHFVGLIIAIVGLVLMLIKASSVIETTSVGIYGGTLVVMFLASTLYHWVSQKGLKSALKLLDHSAIYLLIAGTYTPLLMVSLDGWVSWVSMIIIWSLAAFGVSFKLLTGTKYPKIALVTYLAMGWFALVLIYPLIQAVPHNGLWFLLAGGLFFSVGVLFYVAKQKQYTHAIWHLFVVAGCSCHFFTVYWYVI